MSILKEHSKSGRDRFRPGATGSGLNQELLRVASLAVTYAEEAAKALPLARKKSREWSHRQGNRLVHHILTPEQTELVQRAIANYRTIQDLLGLWENKTIESIFTKQKIETRND